MGCRGRPAADLPARPDGARLVLVDLTGSGRVLETLTVDGAYLDARQVGAVARVVVRSGPRLRFVQPDGRRSDAAARRQNRRVVEESSIDDWLPRYELEQRRRAPAGAARRLRAGQPPGGVLRHLDAHRAHPGPPGPLGTGDPVSVVADGDTVYGTGSSLYVADDHRGQPEPAAGRRLAAPGAGPGRSAPRSTGSTRPDRGGPGTPPPGWSTGCC